MVVEKTWNRAKSSAHISPPRPGVMALLCAMRFQVLFRGIRRVLDGLNVVGVRQVGLVSGFLNRSLYVMFSGVQVVLSGLFEMFSCLLVMFSCLLRHV
jgi:hypothetical protein